MSNTDDPRPPGSGGPLHLDYEQLSPPEQRRNRSLKLLSLFIAAGWLPFICGVVTGAATSQSGSPLIIHQHLTGAILFMTVGILTTAIGVTGMLRLRSLTGTIIAGVVLLAQLSIAVCAGLAR